MHTIPQPGPTRQIVLSPDTVDEAPAWLDEHGAAGYLDGDYLRIVDGNAVEGHAMLMVPFGDGLARGNDSMWCRVQRPASVVDPVSGLGTRCDGRRRVGVLRRRGRRELGRLGRLGRRRTAVQRSQLGGPR